MAADKKSSKPTVQTGMIAQNRKARYEYTIGDTMEAGLVLQGTEVKALRLGKANIAEAYAAAEGNEIWLLNSHIDEHKQGNRFNHETRRKRKLLLHRREINKLLGLLKTKGVTLVPLKLYFDDKGRVKLLMGVATGKKKHEKREAEKERDWKRSQSRIMKEHG